MCVFANCTCYTHSIVDENATATRDSDVTEKQEEPDDEGGHRWLSIVVGDGVEQQAHVGDVTWEACSVVYGQYLVCCLHYGAERPHFYTTEKGKHCKILTWHIFYVYLSKRNMFESWCDTYCCKTTNKSRKTFVAPIQISYKSRKR